MTFGLLEQGVLLSTLVVGMIIGELFASSVFGRPKKFLLVIAETIVFVAVLVLLSNSILLSTQDLLLTAGINFVLGLTVVVVSRAITTGVGYAGELPAKGLLGMYSREEKLALNVIQTLLDAGVEMPAVKEALRKSGFSQKGVDELTSRKYVQKPNKLLQKVLELEKELGKLRENKPSRKRG